MALKYGMTLILPLENLLVYMCLEGDWRISIYLNMFNDLIMFWTLINGLFCIKLSYIYIYMLTIMWLLRLVLNISFGFLDLFLFSLCIDYTGWNENKFWFDLIWFDRQGGRKKAETGAALDNEPVMAEAITQFA